MIYVGHSETPIFSGNFEPSSLNPTNGHIQKSDLDLGLYLFRFRHINLTISRLSIYHHGVFLLSRGWSSESDSASLQSVFVLKPVWIRNRVATLSGTIPISDFRSNTRTSFPLPPRLSAEKNKLNCQTSKAKQINVWSLTWIW